MKDEIPLLNTMPGLGLSLVLNVALLSSAGMRL